jgi:hypothetical protein
MFEITGRTIATNDVQWTRFIGMLCRALGDPDESRCCHDHRHSKPILEALGFDVESSLVYLEEHGGYCDCEILMNVDSDEVRSKWHTWLRIHELTGRWPLGVKNSHRDDRANLV